MHKNVLIFEHNYPLGNRRLFSQTVFCEPGRLTFESPRIAKRLARFLSEDHKKCRLEWANAMTNGCVEYVNGEKTHETFNKN